MDDWRPGRDIGVRQMSDDIANHSNQVRETADKFYVLWRGQVVHTPDNKIRLFDTERDAYGFLAPCDDAGGIIG
jgi:hypothetical protein